MLRTSARSTTAPTHHSNSRRRDRVHIQGHTAPAQELRFLLLKGTCQCCLRLSLGLHCRAKLFTALSGSTMRTSPKGSLTVDDGVNVQVFNTMYALMGAMCIITAPNASGGAGPEVHRTRDTSATRQRPKYILLRYYIILRLQYLGTRPAGWGAVRALRQKARKRRARMPSVHDGQCHRRVMT